MVNGYPFSACRSLPSLFPTMASAAPKKTVQVFGRKRAAVAVALCKEGKGLIRVNGQPLHLLEPEVLRVKVRSSRVQLCQRLVFGAWRLCLLFNLVLFPSLQTMEPVLLLGRDRFAGVDIRIRVKGGGHSSQVYAIRQAIAKALVSYTQKCASASRASVSLRVSRRPPSWLLLRSRRRAEQAGGQGHPAGLRQDAARFGPSPPRGEEVRRPWRSRKVPEELPLSGARRWPGGGAPVARLPATLRGLCSAAASHSRWAWCRRPLPLLRCFLATAGGSLQSCRLLRRTVPVDRWLQCPLSLASSA